QLSLSGDVERLAIQILDQAVKQKLTSGKSPSGIVAAIIYVACKLCSECRTQGHISQKAQVTEVTIRNRYKELIQKISFEIDL
ncbi:MAG: transcription initiation factor IIB, partial [Candidatus Thorarchaeota archaeon]